MFFKWLSENGTRPRYYKERYIWVKIRIVHETNKSILVYNRGKKVWIAKSRIRKIRLKKGVFEIYISE